MMITFTPLGVMWAIFVLCLCIGLIIDGIRAHKRSEIRRKTFDESIAKISSGLQDTRTSLKKAIDDIERTLSSWRRIPYTDIHEVSRYVFPIDTDPDKRVRVVIQLYMIEGHDREYLSIHTKKKDAPIFNRSLPHNWFVL